MEIKHKKTYILTAIFITLAFLSTGSTIHAEETTNLDIGAPCLLSTQCKTGVCETSSLSTTPNRYCVCNTGQHCKDKYGQTAADEVWTCSTGNTQSSNLHFCDSNKREAQMPITQAPTSSSADDSDTPANATMVDLSPPKISIPIPELESFANIQVASGEEVNVPYMAEYIIAIYKYSVVIGSILAVMMLMIGGIMYMMGGMNATLITQSKKIIVGAISGIVVLISSYLMLNLINPNLTTLSSISIQTIEEVTLEDWEEATDKTGEGYVSTGEPFVPSGTPIEFNGEPVILDGNQTYEMANKLAVNFDTPFCNVKEASNKSNYPGLNLNYKYLGTLDCNVSKQSRHSIAKIVLHNGFGYKQEKPRDKIKTMLAMWRRNRIGYNIVCHKKGSSWSHRECKKREKAGESPEGKKYFITAPAATHYAIEYDGTIYQVAGENLIATHCAGTKGKTSCNRDSIGIDLSYYKDDDKVFHYTDAQYESLAKLIKAITSAHGLPINDSVVHAHADCQANRVDPKNLDWERLGSLSGGNLNSSAHPKTSGGRAGYSCN